MKYGVKVMFTYSIEPDNRKFYEESIYLIDAESFDEAYKKAEEYVKDFDMEHMNPKGQKVKTEKIDFIDCFLHLMKKMECRKFIQQHIKINHICQKKNFIKQLQINVMLKKCMI